MTTIENTDAEQVERLNGRITELLRELDKYKSAQETARTSPMTKREFQIKLGTLLADALETGMNRDDLIEALSDGVTREEVYKEQRRRAAASY